MGNPHTHIILELLIEYFDIGNTETDSVAKMILQSSHDYTSYWQDEVRKFQSGTDWTGIRAAEAELISSALRTLLEEHS